VTHPALVTRAVEAVYLVPRTPVQDGPICVASQLPQPSAARGRAAFWGETPPATTTTTIRHHHWHSRSRGASQRASQPLRFPPYPTQGAEPCTLSYCSPRPRTPRTCPHQVTNNGCRDSSQRSLYQLTRSARNPHPSPTQPSSRFASESDLRRAHEAYETRTGHRPLPTRYHGFARLRQLPAYIAAHDASDPAATTS
jgi:hypothetical protein